MHRRRRKSCRAELDNAVKIGARVESITDKRECVKPKLCYRIFAVSEKGVRPLRLGVRSSAAGRQTEAEGLDVDPSSANRIDSSEANMISAYVRYRS